MSDARPADEYELTIVGALGPVMRSALRPGQVAQTRSSTTFVAVSVDLETIVERLDAPGLRLESAYRVDDVRDR